MERFLGTVAVVTGSGSGIGAAISKELYKRGFTVVGLDINEINLQKLKKELNETEYAGEYHAIKCDIRDEQDVISTFEKINGIGKISILINNAGILRHTPIHEMTSEVFDSLFNTNVKGLVLCARQAIKSMKENSIQGHIVNTCSVCGLPGWIFNLNIAMYSAAKHAVKVITDGLRREMILNKTKIKVSSLSPGFVESGMTVGHLPSDPFGYIKSEDVANACIAILDTPPGVTISELTVLPTNEMV
ncbi:farnesol dehydrogenase-like [Planococcus citri]|uniref:farnesol dehydrogenase-like n=1 Tax=Planococcus citri TaxID=170843 RepID=UPI0031F800A1